MELCLNHFISLIFVDIIYAESFLSSSVSQTNISLFNQSFNQSSINQLIKQSIKLTANTANQSIIQKLHNSKS